MRESHLKRCCCVGRTQRKLIFVQPILYYTYITPKMFRTPYNFSYDDTKKNTIKTLFYNFIELMKITKYQVNILIKITCSRSSLPVLNFIHF